MTGEPPVTVVRPRRAVLSLRLLAALALLALLALACLAGLLVLHRALDPLARAERTAALARNQLVAAQLAPLDLAVAAAWRVLPLVLVAATAFVALRVAWRRWGWTPSLAAGAYVRALEAQHQPGQVPHTLTYSPHLVLRQSPPADPDVDRPALPAEGTPTFAQLLDQGRVGRGNPLVLGFDAATGAEITGSWLDLYSTAVSGMPGSGKTTSQRFLACQTALQGAQFAVCDPHAEAGDDSLAATLASLQAAFVAEPASSERAILEVVRFVADVGRRRVAGKDANTTPLILWLDETTALLGRSSVAEPLAALLERVAQEYRKRHVFVCASGQIWTAARTASELRDSFASVLCHRMKRAQARLLLPTEEAEQVERLAVGRAVLWRTSGATAVVSIPNTRAEDVRRVGALLATGRLPERPLGSRRDAAVTPVAKPDGSHIVADGEATAERLPSAPVRAEAARAAQLFLDGHDPAQIVAELRGVTSKQGGKYQAALAEVLSLIREGLHR